MPLNPFISADIGEVSLIPCTEDAVTGAPTKVTAAKAQFRGWLDGANIQGNINQEDIRAITSQQINMVNLARGKSFQLTEIMTTGAVPSALINLVEIEGYELFFITCVMGAFTATGYARVANVGVPIEGDGKKTISADFSPTGHGADAFKWIETP